MIAGHYRLVEHIGSGAMGVVWRALDERLERSVAVKQILTQPGLSEAERQTVRQRAMREARNAARFQHPNAIVVFDITEHGGEPCLVMEYMPADSLSAILVERETLPIPEIARIGEQVAAALIAAHRAGIVHRDIKPGNILIDDNGLCKITDFGISRATGDFTLTQTGLIGGTPAYLAPELARGADPTAGSDVFALGATLYHAIEGLPPYGDNTNQLALLYAAANGRVHPPEQAGPATGLLTRLLSPEPQDRPSMAQARDELAALAKGSGAAATRVAAAPAPPTATSPAPAPRADPPPWRKQPAEPPPPHGPPGASGAARAASSGTAGGDRRRKLIAGVAGAAAVVVAVVLTVVLSNGGKSPEAQQSNSSTPPSATGRPSSTTGAPTSQRNAEPVKVEWGPAGNFVLGYYYNPQSSWNKLTPQAQQLFGSKQAHNAYWDEHEVAVARNARAYEKGNNEDGSVDIRIHVQLGDGSEQQVYLRVISVNGKKKITGDPRLESNTKPKP